MSRPLVADDFAIPAPPATPEFRLEPLGPEHNASDHAAWTSSIEHIRATPGFESWRWPPAAGMSLEDNLADLRRHADDFARRAGFTYTVIETSSGEVIGCVYIYPARGGGQGTDVHSWVRADRAELDAVLYSVVSGWLSEHWPLESVGYAPR